MLNIRLAIVSLGLIIAAIGHWLATEGLVCARIAGTHALNATSAAAGWLTATLSTATQAIEANRQARIAARAA